MQDAMTQLTWRIANLERCQAAVTVTRMQFVHAACCGYSVHDFQALTAEKRPLAPAPYGRQRML